MIWKGVEIKPFLTEGGIIKSVSVEMREDTQVQGGLRGSRDKRNKKN